mgnify:CR=1 FL=1
MKVMFPQHIKKWFFSTVAFSIMGFSITFIQLVVLAVWVVIALWIFSACKNSWSESAGAIFAILVFLIFMFIAFFNMSEMSLVEFIIKRIKDSFIDESKKFQINYTKDNPTEVTIAKSKQEKWKQRIEIKEELDKEKLSKLADGGIL